MTAAEQKSLTVKLAEAIEATLADETTDTRHRHFTVAHRVLKVLEEEGIIQPSSDGQGRMYAPTVTAYGWTTALDPLPALLYVSPPGPLRRNPIRRLDLVDGLEPSGWDLFDARNAAVCAALLRHALDHVKTDPTDLLTGGTR